MIEVEVRGHDKAVLDSYEKFTLSAARELDINVHNTFVFDYLNLHTK